MADILQFPAIRITYRLKEKPVSASRRIAFLYVGATLLLAVVVSFAGVFAVFHEAPELTDFLFVLYVFFPIVPGLLATEAVVLLSSAPQRLWESERSGLAAAYLVLVVTPSVLAYVIGVLAATLFDPRREYFTSIELILSEVLFLAVPLASLLAAGILLLPLLSRMRAAEARRLCTAA